MDSERGPGLFFRAYHVRRGLGGALRIVEDDGELVVAAVIRRRGAGVGGAPFGASRRQRRLLNGAGDVTCARLRPSIVENRR